MDNATIHTELKSQCDSNTIIMKSEIHDDIVEIRNDINIKEEWLDNDDEDNVENVNTSLEDHNMKDHKYYCSICGHISENEHRWLVHKAKHLRIVMPTYTPPKNSNMDLLVEKKMKPARRNLSKRFQDRISDLNSTPDLKSSEETGKRVSRQGHRCRICSQVFRFRSDLLEHCEEKHTPKNRNLKKGRLVRPKSINKSVKNNSAIKCPKKPRLEDDALDSSKNSDDSEEKKCDTLFYGKAKRIKLHEEPAESLKQTEIEHGSQNFICRTCGLVFAKVSLLHEHVFKEHIEANMQLSSKKLRNFAKNETKSNSNNTSVALQGETWIEIDAECPIVDTGNKIVRRKLSENSEENDNCVEISDYNGNMNIHFTIRQEDSGNTEDGHKCEECEEKFALRSELELHISTKHIITIFPCPYCEQLFTDLEILQKHGLEEHDSTKHSNSEKPTTPVKESKSPDIRDCDKNFICSMCQMVFTKKKDIRNHIFLAHMVEATGDDYKSDNSETRLGSCDIPAVYVCKICFKEFYTEDDLQQHFSEGHKTIKDKFLGKSENNEVDFKTSRRKQNIVTRTYDELTVLDSKSLKMNKPVQQFNILKEFMRAAESSEEHEVHRSEMDALRKRKTEKKVTAKSKNITRQGEHKNFMCPHCQQQFQFITKLRSHILKRHSDFYFDGLIEQFKLDETPETEDGFIRHDSAHKDNTDQQAIATFACAICKREYTKQKFLDTHMFNKHIHRCGYCHTVFHSAQHIAKHVFEKHSADEVPQENNAYKTQKQGTSGFRMPPKKTQNDKKMFTGDCIYECHMCDRRFAVWRYLQDHRRRVHLLTNLYGSYSKNCALSGCKTDESDPKTWYHKCGVEILENWQTVVT